VSFNGERLRLVRQFAEMTQTELGDKVAVSQAAIADYERNRKQPSDSVAEALAAVSKCHLTFFYSHDDERFSEDEYNFRRRITATERLRKKVVAQASLFCIVLTYLREQVELPRLNFPSCVVDSDESIEQAAETARVHWGLGIDGPIASMSRVLENNGVVLTVADSETATKVDAFSRYGRTSVAVLNTAKGSPSRTFFDMAHECAHGVLHVGTRKSDELKEKEADRFAGAFLMPRRAFTREFWSKQTISWLHLFEIKKRWGTSLAAILVRAHQLGLLDTAAYRIAFQSLSRRGWRTAEPEEPAAEQPELFSMALQQYCHDQRKTLMDLSSEIGFSPELFSGVTGIPIPTGSPDVTSLDAYRRRRVVET